MAPALLLVPAALASFVLAFGTGVEFVRFTSLRPLLGGVSEAGPDVRQGWLAALQDRSILASLAWDLGLLLLFVGQHSLMATETVKAWSSRYFGVLQRSLYVACTALALQVWGPGRHILKEDRICGRDTLAWRGMEFRLLIKFGFRRRAEDAQDSNLSFCSSTANILLFIKKGVLITGQAHW
ncbi:nurim isoform X4 [Loxodonta africana]|uniref:nurim isoform X4 n=1 Tax=Loxodonta africana TaxID=9785 RepID=UPI0030CA63E0